MKSSNGQPDHQKLHSGEPGGLWGGCTGSCSKCTELGVATLAQATPAPGHTVRLPPAPEMT